MHNASSANTHQILPPDWRRKLKVLVVDDSSDDLRLLFEIMSIQDINDQF